MNRLGKISTVLALGLCSSLSSCKKSNSSASGAMFIESCALNCSSNGASGGQVSCGVSSIFQNQEISVLFSKKVKLSSVGNQSFSISETGTGAVPVGLFLLDPLDARRVIFRPDLTFDLNNNPVFGFRPDTSYDVIISGTNQGDSPPYVESVGGTENTSRLFCTVTTDLGISDPVPGPPVASVFVSTAGNPSTPADGAVGVLVTTKITINFNDLINKGTLALPVPNPPTNPLGIGTSSALTVKLDPDGNIANSSDQVTLQGSYTFDPDLPTSTTQVVFDLPAGQDFPSAGANLASPRKIILVLGSGIKDLTGNALLNPGPVVFTPEVLSFPPVTIPPGGEQFTFTGPNPSFITNCDQDRSGASWGETTNGLLTPGLGGGSGRLGDLKVANGEVVTLRTGPTFGVGRIQFQTTGPLDGDTVEINGIQFTFVDGLTQPTPGFIEFENQFPALTLTNLVRELNNSTDPLITPATYALENSDTLRITYDTPGFTGLTFTFDAYKLILGVPTPTGSVLSISGPTVPGGTAHMLDGVDNESFVPGNLLDNFDFQATPGGTPNPIAVANGQFEFATVSIETGGTLRFEGPNAARLLVRGRVSISGTINVAGESELTHQSDSPQGQIGGLGGPNAGNGGRGADRPDNSGTNLIAPIGTEPFRPWNFGIVNPGGTLNGFSGTGVGQVGTIGAGPQGGPYRMPFPFDDVTLGALQTNLACESEQVGGAAGGGAYSLDGGIGVAVAETPVASQGEPNTPSDTAGGDAGSVGLEPATGPLSHRKLSPDKVPSDLRGGSGGGGGGAHVAQTRTNGIGSPDLCIDVGAQINQYRSHSAGAGGGGGGAVQAQAGRAVILGGGIDASGGSGGSADVFNLVPSATLSAPGGAGSGGAILMQARQLFLSAVPNRLSIAGGGGGVGFPNTLGQFSTGGNGGPGLARVEAQIAPNFDEVASILAPFDPLNPGDSVNFLSVGTWIRSRFTPSSFQGAQSCWMRPAGSFFAVLFDQDAPGDPGWEMDLVLNNGAGNVTVPYRSPNGILPGGQTYEQFWGQLLDRDLLPGEVGAPLVVRFQGAKLTGAMPDPCHVEISGPTSPLSPGSLTPWVRHPAELNAFPQAPDMIRFTIIFDASKLEFLKIVGVTNLRVSAQPN